MRCVFILFLEVVVIADETARGMILPGAHWIFLPENMGFSDIKT